jgi:hypothetical protein
MTHWIILMWMWLIGMITGGLIYHWVQLGKRRIIGEKSKENAPTNANK